MSREQRRLDRRQQTRAGGKSAASSGGGGSRRTPVKVGGGGFPTMPLAILGGILLVGALLAYLIYQANQQSDNVDAATAAERDDSPSLPGDFHATQGRSHMSGGLTGSEVPPFCEGVAQSDLALARGGKPYTAGTPSADVTPGTPAEGPGETATAAPSATATPAATEAADGTTTPGGETPAGTVEPTNTVPPTDCYSSNPPSSGRHLNVQRNIEVIPGAVFNIPADPAVYPHDIEIPRASIAHILEHAGVYVGWNCADGDQACLDAVSELEDLVNDRIDNHDNRVVMAKNLDLPVGTFGVSSWTRAMTFPNAEWPDKKGEVQDFIGTHSCRFDPEGFCK